MKRTVRIACLLVIAFAVGAALRLLTGEGNHSSDDNLPPTEDRVVSRRPPEHPPSSNPIEAPASSGEEPKGIEDESRREEGEPTPADVESTAGETYRRKLYEVYEQFGAVDLFSSRFDPVPVRPMGVTASEWAADTASDGAPPSPTEDWYDALGRVSELNRSIPGPLGQGGFESVSFRTRDRLEVSIGRQRGGPGWDPLLALSAEVGQLLQSDHLDAEQRRFVEEWYRRSMRLNDDVFRALSSLRSSGKLRPAENLSAFLVKDRRAMLWSKGDDPELDRLLEEVDAIDRNVLRRVREAVAR